MEDADLVQRLAAAVRRSVPPHVEVMATPVRYAVYPWIATAIQG